MMDVVMETHSSVVVSKLTEDKNVINQCSCCVGGQSCFPQPISPFPLQSWCFSRCFLAGPQSQPVRGELWVIKGWCLFSPQELGFSQGGGAPLQPCGVALSGCDGRALVAERIIRNSGLPPKFLLCPTEQTGRGFFASINRESADNPITAAPQ